MPPLDDRFCGCLHINFWCSSRLVSRQNLSSSSSSSWKMAIQLCYLEISSSWTIKYTRCILVCRTTQRLVRESSPVHVDKPIHSFAWILLTEKVFASTVRRSSGQHQRPLFVKTFWRSGNRPRCSLVLRSVMQTLWGSSAGICDADSMGHPGPPR